MIYGTSYTGITCLQSDPKQFLFALAFSSPFSPNSRSRSNFCQCEKKEEERSSVLCVQKIDITRHIYIN